MKLNLSLGLAFSNWTGLPKFSGVVLKLIWIWQESIHQLLLDAYGTALTVQNKKVPVRPNRSELSVMRVTTTTNQF